MLTMREKSEMFHMRLSVAERRRLDALARRLMRSRGDTLRWLLNQATTDPEYPNGRPDGLPPRRLLIEGDTEIWGWREAELMGQEW
jgi:hypothetical protein